MFPTITGLGDSLIDAINTVKYLYYISFNADEGEIYNEEDLNCDP